MALNVRGPIKPPATRRPETRREQSRNNQSESGVITAPAAGANTGALSFASRSIIAEPARHGKRIRISSAPTTTCTDRGKAFGSAVGRSGVGWRPGVVTESSGHETQQAVKLTSANYRFSPAFDVHCYVELECAHVHAASTPIRPHGGRFASYAFEIRDETMPSGASMVPAVTSTTSGSSRSNSSSVVPHATQKCLVAWSEDAHLAVDPLVDRDERAPLTQAWNADPELRRQISQEHRATSASMEQAYVTVPHAHRPVTG